jgi:hypothetical protein
MRKFVVEYCVQSKDSEPESMYKKSFLQLELHDEICLNVRVKVRIQYALRPAHVSCCAASQMNPIHYYVRIK